MKGARDEIIESHQTVFPFILVELVGFMVALFWRLLKGGTASFVLLFVVLVARRLMELRRVIVVSSDLLIYRPIIGNSQSVSLNEIRQVVLKTVQRTYFLRSSFRSEFRLTLSNNRIVWVPADFKKRDEIFAMLSDQCHRNQLSDL